jgi:hypothetical protein
MNPQVRPMRRVLKRYTLPAVASHAIGFAQPRPSVHSPGVGAYKENAGQPGVQPIGRTNTPEVTD